MALQRRTARPSQPKPAQIITVPSPNGGMDGRIPLSEGNTDIAIYSYNMASDESGMRVRSGYAEQCIDLVNTDSIGVRTLVPYDPPRRLAAERKLFAMTNEGIWDVTTAGAPVQVLTFLSTVFDAGIGVYQHYVTDAGDDLLFYADSENGLFTYTRTTDTWAPAAGITGIVVADISFVMVHKQRIWFCVSNSADAYYLGIGAIAGAVTKFQFGNKFKRGGTLVGLYSWTLDGGSGVDDYLVGISSAGDVLPYQGSDPEAVSGDLWQLRGVFYVGQVVGGVRCASEFGADLHIISSEGITPLSQLLQGVGASLSRDGIGAKTAFYLRPDIRKYAADTGWNISFFPSIAAVVLSTPQRLNGQYVQYVYDVPKDTFGFWRDVPMTCSVEWQGNVYFGTKDSRVCVMNTDLDEVKLNPVNPNLNGKEINFSGLFAFTSYGASGTFKRGVSIRPDFASNAPVDFRAKFVYDYNIVEDNSVQDASPFLTGRWDSGLWDSAIWGGDGLQNSNVVIGGVGIGRRLAIAVLGNARANTYLLSYDVMWNNGGML